MTEPIVPSIKSSEILGQVLAQLARGADLETRSLEEVLAGITETAARTLRVVRVNVWLYDEDRSAIRCIEGFDARTHRHEAGDVLEAAKYPNYFHALDLLRTIAAMDAESDPRTEELTQGYLKLHGIQTMLDVPLMRSGTVIGVICHEHAGEARRWTETDRLFAGSVGDLVSLVLETARLAELEREQRVLRMRLERMGSIESLSEVTSGVAHDFRNLLTAIVAHAAAIRDEGVGGFIEESAVGILAAVTRATKLCDQLSLYSGQQPVAPEAVDVGALVSEVLQVLGARVPPNLRITLDVREGLLPVLGDELALHRALTNLIVNALDATSARGGTIRIRCGGDAPQLERLGHVLDFRKGAGALTLIEVSDDGVGMSAKVERRLFQPFHTTKGAGRGLGLATVLGTVRGHGGVIAVETSEGAGTCFRLWFPVAV